MGLLNGPPRPPVPANHLPLDSGAREPSTSQVSWSFHRPYWAVVYVILPPGRPPWYDSHGQIAEAFVIGMPSSHSSHSPPHLPSHPCALGLAGGSASGKTTVARRIIEALGVPWVTLLSMDSFYKVLSPEQSLRAAENEYNFDCPGESCGASVPNISCCHDNLILSRGI